MKSEETDTQARILAELAEIHRWIRVLAEPALRERLAATLKDKNDLLVYQASIGGSTRDVEQLTKVSKSAVSSSWSRWAAAGIMRPTDVSGRYERLVDLKTLGFDV